MTLNGTITRVTPATGAATVIRAQYDNAANRIDFFLQIAGPAPAKPTIIRATITGADVAALGPSWSDDDLITWWANKNGLTSS